MNPASNSEVQVERALGYLSESSWYLFLGKPAALKLANGGMEGVEG